MTTAKEKAESFVRSKIPALMELTFGCEFEMRNSLWKRGLLCRVNDDGTYAPIGNSEGGTHEIKHLGECEDEGCRIHKIIGHPIQLQDWLRVLGESKGVYGVAVADTGDVLFDRVTSADVGREWVYTHSVASNLRIKFDMETGQPKDESAYQAFNEILGV